MKVKALLKDEGNKRISGQLTQSQDFDANTAVAFFIFLSYKEPMEFVLPQRS